MLLRNGKHHNSPEDGYLRTVRLDVRRVVGTLKPVLLTMILMNRAQASC
jgi:hypothetical protein